MSAGDIAVLLGYLVSAWSVGFCGGFLLTRFKDAVSDVTRTG